MWSASIAMMHGFQGRVDKDHKTLEMVITNKIDVDLCHMRTQINEFCKDVSNGLHQCHQDCHEGIEVIKLAIQLATCLNLHMKNHSLITIRGVI